MRRSRWLLCVVACAALLLACVAPGEEASPRRGVDRGAVHGAPPEPIDRESRYLFYLHGKIIEDEGPRPESPRFGIYEYEAILETFAERGFVVISETRERETRGSEYARKIAGQVETLLDAGVPPDRITVVGFSKGGGIAILTSALLGNAGVNFVILASCGDWLFGPDGPPDLAGRILSIHEASDELGGSCRRAFEASTRISAWEEIELQLGGGHGAFYRPRAEWIDPVASWARGEDPAGAPGDAPPRGEPR